MGRKVTDGQALDMVAPDATLIEKGELYRIDNFTGFAGDQIDAAEVDRGFALDVTEFLWSVKVPAGTCGTKGNYVKWSAGTGFKAGATDLVDDTTARTVNSIAKVESVRNSAGNARLKLVIL